MKEPAWGRKRGKGWVVYGSCTLSARPHGAEWQPLLPTMMIGQAFSRVASCEQHCLLCCQMHLVGPNPWLASCAAVVTMGLCGLCACPTHTYPPLSHELEGSCRILPWHSAEGSYSTIHAITHHLYKSLRALAELCHGIQPKAVPAPSTHSCTICTRA